MSFVYGWIGGTFEYLSSFVYSPPPTASLRISITPFSFSALPDDCTLPDDVELGNYDDVDGDDGESDSMDY